MPMSEFSTDIDESMERAVRIHEVILAIARNEEIIVGFPNRWIYKDAYSTLRRMMFKKPFFQSKREWTRSAIVFEPDAYKYVCPHVELEFFVDNQSLFFNGAGFRLRKDSFVHARLHSLGPPTYWIIQLGPHIGKFKGLLDYDFPDDTPRVQDHLSEDDTAS